jgi:hypothetical protein
LAWGAVSGVGIGWGWKGDTYRLELWRRGDNGAEGEDEGREGFEVIVAVFSICTIGVVQVGKRVEVGTGVHCVGV